MDIDHPKGKIIKYKNFNFKDQDIIDLDELLDQMEDNVPINEEQIWR
jgi:hypothetical protein